MSEQTTTNGGFLGDLAEAFAAPAGGGCCGSPAAATGTAASAAARGRRCRTLLRDRGRSQGRGLVLRHRGKDRGGRLRCVRLRRVNTEAGTDAALAAVSADRMKDTVATLAQRAFTGRRVASEGGAAARVWLVGALREIGAAVEIDTFEVPGYAAPAANLYATWPSQDGQAAKVLADRALRRGRRHHELHRPGAADNAAGVAVVLEAARRAGRSRRSGSGRAARR